MVENRDDVEDWLPAETMVTEADAVVIGAGALGLSVGYHLANLGRRVAIVDQFAPGSQTCLLYTSPSPRD